jgi:hypothetical protein
MLISSQMPISPENRYPMTPKAGKPNKSGLTPVVMIVDEILHYQRIFPASGHGILREIIRADT